MKKNKIFSPYIFFLIVISLSGCAYLTHPKETLFLKSLADSQQEMQAAVNKQEKLFNKLKSAVDKGRLNKPLPKNVILSRYGQPTLCKEAPDQPGIKEICIYRKPGGLSTQIIMLNFDAQDKLFSWQVQNPD